MCFDLLPLPLGGMDIHFGTCLTHRKKKISRRCETLAWKVSKIIPSQKERVQCETNQYYTFGSSVSIPHYVQAT